MCSHVLTRATAHGRVDGHTHVNGQGSPPSQGCLEDGVGRVRPGASVLPLFSKCTQISVGPTPWRSWGQAGKEGSWGWVGGCREEAPAAPRLYPKRGLAPPFAARVPAQPGFPSSRGQQAATAGSGRGHGTHTPAEGSAEPQSGDRCPSLRYQGSRGSWARATHLDGSRESDLSDPP